jgi:Synaptobrevin.
MEAAGLSKMLVPFYTHYTGFKNLKSCSGNSEVFLIFVIWIGVLCHVICHSVWCVFVFTHMQVVGIMRVNVEKVLERDQKLSELDNRAGEPKWYC